VKTPELARLHVRIFTDQGLFGDGEGVDAVSGAEGIIQGIRLRGRAPQYRGHLGIEPNRSIFGGSQGGQFTAALTAVEIALWDLAGKALGVPIYQLMGGKVRERTRIYMDMGVDDPKDPNFPAEMKKLTDGGFTMAKIDIDNGGDPRAPTA